MGLEFAKTAPTAGTHEEQKAASVLANSGPEAFRGVAARCNYVVQDNVDLQYATKEAS